MSALLGGPSDGRMIFGSAHDALAEAQWSYIDGHYLSAILAVQVYLEKSLSSLIESANLGRPKRSYAELLRDACAQRIISEEERDMFDRLRRLRNPSAHYRSPNHSDHPMRRALFEGEDPDALLEKDARTAVRALVGLMNPGEDVIPTLSQ
jgi:HEPN domain-containing protein